MRYIKDFYKKVDEQGDFSLWLNFPAYESFSCSSGTFFNAETGEEYGQEAYNIAILFDENFNLLKEPILTKKIKWKQT